MSPFYGFLEYKSTDDLEFDFITRIDHDIFDKAVEQLFIELRYLLRSFIYNRSQAFDLCNGLIRLAVIEKQPPLGTEAAHGMIQFVNFTAKGFLIDQLLLFQIGNRGDLVVDQHDLSVKLCEFESLRRETVFQRDELIDDGSNDDLLVHLQLVIHGDERSGYFGFGNAHRRTFGLAFLMGSASPLYGILSVYDTEYLTAFSAMDGT